MAGALLWLTGCVTRKPIPPTPLPPPPSAEETQKRAYEAQAIGTWENLERGRVQGRMIFEPDGRLRFEGGLSYFNPARWRVDPARHELILSMPETPDEKLQIFQLYLHQGVKSLDRPAKEVTYDFGPETWSLLVAGWTYSKSTSIQAAPQEEPVLK